MQTQPLGTFVPLLVTGQLTATHVLLKNGNAPVDFTVPLNPLEQVHWPGTLIPVLLLGQRTGLQVERYEPTVCPVTNDSIPVELLVDETYPL